MSFSSYKSLSATIEQFQIFYQEENFVQEIATNISSYFREDLQLMMQEGVVDNSEFAICENLIYPIIKEVWKSYRQKFLLWSHHYLNYDQELSGFPEYILAQRSPLGKVVFAKPYLLLVEAKQDKFHDGWGQCLAEMVAAQQLNEKPDIVVFGIVSNGVTWEFGKLEGQHFTKNTTPFLIYQLDQLFAVTNYIFQQCEIQLEQWLNST